MAQLEFDADAALAIEAIYRIEDAERRRRLVRATLAASRGERILDVGCGPGFYGRELAEEVGSDGAVVGVDASAPMLELAAKRCADHDNVSFHEGDALSLPVDEGAFDAALSVQVLEYVADVPAALREIRRKLRPGGRVVLWDVDWETLSWHSGDPERMQRVLRAWDEHLADPTLPRTLAAKMRDAGFEDVQVDGHLFTTVGELDRQTYGGALCEFIGGFAAGRQGVTADEAAAWAEEQRALGARGEVFFSCAQFCFSAREPRQEA